MPAREATLVPVVMNGVAALGFALLALASGLGFFWLVAFLFALAGALWFRRYRKAA